MYIIKKDGMYLIAYQPSGLTEYDKRGNPVTVYTGVWGSNRRDAKVFDNKAFVDAFSEMIGGQVIQVVMHK